MAVKFNSKISNYENWKNGYELNFAAFRYGHAHEIEAVRTALTIDKTIYFKIFLYASLFELLQSGKLIALGYRDDLPPNDDPDVLAKRCFMDRPKVDDCDNDTIQTGEWKYTDIRILKSGENEPANLAESNPTKEAVAPKVGKRGGGRHSLYPKARFIFKQLFDTNPQYSEMSADRLLEIFNEAYLLLYSDPSLAVAPVSARALRNYLKEYRQELAETGNN